MRCYDHIEIMPPILTFDITPHKKSKEINDLIEKYKNSILTETAWNLVIAMRSDFDFKWLKENKKIFNKLIL